MVDGATLAALTGIYGLLILNTALTWQVRTTQKLCPNCPKVK